MYSEYLPRKFSSALLDEAPKFQMLAASTQEKVRQLGLPGINLGADEAQVFATAMLETSTRDGMYRASSALSSVQSRLSDAGAIVTALRTPGTDAVSSSAFENAGEVISAIEALQKATSELGQKIEKELHPPEDAAPRVRG